MVLPGTIASIPVIPRLPPLKVVPGARGLDCGRITTQLHPGTSVVVPDRKPVPPSPGVNKHKVQRCL
jgi:hypothetical protein